MGSPVSEVAYIALKPGVDLESSTSEGKLWQEALSTIAAQEGYQRAYQGRKLEDPNVLVLVVDWDTHASHLKFMKSPTYESFKSNLVSVMEGVHLHHIQAAPHPPSVISRAPCTEVATFYECEDSFLQNVEKFVKVLEQGKPAGYYGIAFGKVIEQISRPKDVGKEDTGDSPAVVLLIGWESKEVHLEFRDTALFKENIGLLREKNGGAEVFHVSFKAV